MECIIIHGGPDEKERKMAPEDRKYDKHWMPWLKKQLEERGWQVEKPQMPNPWEPVYDDYKKEFEKIDFDENTVLVGHSRGCAFLVRWLGDTKKRVRKLILVAPWKISEEGNEFKKIFYNFNIDKTIKNRVNKIIMFTSDNEEEDGKKSLQIYHKLLGGKVIELIGHGHYTLGDMGTEEFPELIDEILK